MTDPLTPPEPNPIPPVEPNPIPGGPAPVEPPTEVPPIGTPEPPGMS